MVAVPERRAALRAAGYSPASLNAPVIGGDGVAEFGDLIGDADPELESVDDKITVAGLLLHSQLALQDREISAPLKEKLRVVADLAGSAGHQSSGHPRRPVER